MGRTRAGMPKEGEAAAIWVDLASLKPWAKNPRINDDVSDFVAKSIICYGWGRTMVAREQNREIAVGHTTRKAVMTLKERWKASNAEQRKKWHPLAVHTAETNLVPCRFIDLSPRHAHAMALADNRLGEKAQWDKPLVLEIFADYSFEEIEVMGWDEEDLEDWGAEMDPKIPDSAQADDQSKQAKTDFAVLIECTDEQEQLDVLQKLEGMGMKCRALT